MDILSSTTSAYSRRHPVFYQTRRQDWSVQKRYRKVVLWEGIFSNPCRTRGKSYSQAFSWTFQIAIIQADMKSPASAHESIVCVCVCVCLSICVCVCVCLQEAKIVCLTSVMAAATVQSLEADPVLPKLCCAVPACPRSLSSHTFSGLMDQIPMNSVRYKVISLNYFCLN